jgi:hypothetical protein
MFTDVQSNFFFIFSHTQTRPPSGNSMIWLTRRVRLALRKAEEIVHDYASFLLRFDTRGDEAFCMNTLQEDRAMPRYRKAEQNTIDPYKAQPLPLGRPVAVYYRQSSEGQIGNISTTLQTVDMVEHTRGL